MKRLLMVTLLLLLASAFISCNSYDVEGKPEVASNPAKKVFAYYPWDSSTVPNPDDSTTPDEEVSDEATDEAVDNEVNDETADETVNDETVTDEVTADDDAIVVALKADLPENLTQEFEIYNRGVTGELKIFKINMLDPDGNLIDAMDSAVYKEYKNLFKFQVQKTSNGVAQEGWNDKILTFDNFAAAEGTNIAALCPLDINAASDIKKCKKSFSELEFNAKFKILLSYNKTAAEELTNNPPADYKLSGDFSIEICTNDPSKEKTATCGNDATSYKIQITRQPNKPPKPIIKVLFDYTTGGEMSYRNIKDKVSMNLKNTCVSDPDKPEDSKTCLADWQKRYYIKYKWEMVESPTPLIEKSQIKLPDYSNGFAGQWLPDSLGDDPKRAEFTGLMITPRRYADENPDYNEDSCTDICGTTEPTNTKDEFYFLDLSNYLICRQKYCEKFKTKYYKVNIQAETVDKQTDLVSDTADITVLPKIIPQARVVAQLTWDKGYKTNTEWDNGGGVQVDLDIHMIKKISLEAPKYNYTPLEGVLGTIALPASELPNFDPYKPEDYKYFRHDDCSFSDSGLSGADGDQTIAWNASLDIDNKWGGNNFETPETIGLGPIEDNDGNGIPDDSIMDDQYLVVVNYFTCTSSFEDGIDRCTKDYTGDDSAYEINTRVEIFVDGVDAPRPERIKNGTSLRPADNYAATTKNFILKPNEWKVVAVVKWDPSLPSPETNPLYPGDGIVSDVAMTDEEITTNASTYKICNYPSSEAILVPIWSPEDYYSFVERPVNPEDVNSLKIGECY